MSDIISILRLLPNFHHMTGASKDDITTAETSLGVFFSSEYREYVSTFGAASARGHELTGVCNSVRLNVVEVTMDERNINPAVSKDWYVIEQANIDGIVIWQATTGEIYQTTPGSSGRKVCNCLSEYISGNF